MQTNYVEDFTGATKRVDAVQYDEQGNATAYWIDGAWRKPSLYKSAGQKTVTEVKTVVEPVEAMPGQKHIKSRKAVIEPDEIIVKNG